MKKVLSLLLFLYSSLMFAQHEELIVKCTGIPADHIFQAFLQSKGVNENTSQEEIQELTEYFYKNEKEIISAYDILRHEQLIALENQRKENRKAYASDVFMEVLSAANGMISQASNNKAESNRQASELARQQRSSYQQQVPITANNNTQYSTNPQTNVQQSSNKGSIKDLYTSDQTWNRALDQMNSQYGPEKTRQIVQEMRARQSQNEQPSTALQSSSSSNDGSSPIGTVISAITTSRTIITLQIQGSYVTHYATGGKNMMGKNDWKYIGRSPIQSIRMTPYDSQFGRDYSHAANIKGIGYVFFNY